MAFMNRDTLRIRALGRARGRGELVVIGQETRTQQELVEEGHLWQEIASGHRYRFTLSPAHPPCDRWHQLSAVNHKRWGFAINEDGGCFSAALAAVREYGGVLEHPAESRAFKFHGIPEPVSGSWQRTIDGDWVTEVWQSSYGHRARKRTWLLYSGKAIPPLLEWRRIAGQFQIGYFDQKRPQLPKAERAATPRAFRDLLISIARASTLPQADGGTAT